jgi:hypothetical protein
LCVLEVDLDDLSGRVAFHHDMEKHLALGSIEQVAVINERKVLPVGREGP